MNTIEQPKDIMRRRVICSNDNNRPKIGVGDDCTSIHPNRKAGMRDGPIALTMSTVNTVQQPRATLKSEQLDVRRSYSSAVFDGGTAKTLSEKDDALTLLDLAKVVTDVGQFSDTEGLSSLKGLSNRVSNDDTITISNPKTQVEQLSRSSIINAPSGDKSNEKTNFEKQASSVHQDPSSIVGSNANRDISHPSFSRTPRPIDPALVSRSVGGVNHVQHLNEQRLQPIIGSEMKQGNNSCNAAKPSVNPIWMDLRRYGSLNSNIANNSTQSYQIVARGPSDYKNGVPHNVNQHQKSSLPSKTTRAVNVKTRRYNSQPANAHQARKNLISLSDSLLLDFYIEKRKRTIGSFKCPLEFSIGIAIRNHVLLPCLASSDSLNNPEAERMYISLLKDLFHGDHFVTKVKEGIIQSNVDGESNVSSDSYTHLVRINAYIYHLTFIRELRPAPLLLIYKYAVLVIV